MAGLTLGESTPVVHPLAAVAQRPLIRIPSSTRTRRNHGVFLLGDELASVYSSRRQADGLGVTMTVGEGSLVLTGSMTPAQARAMARALVAAAEASEVTQQRAAAETQNEGGAA